jgi:TonB family protein
METGEDKWPCCKFLLSVANEILSDQIKMMRSCVIISLLSSFFCFSQVEQIKVKKEPQTISDSVLTQTAQFPGGALAMNDFIKNNFIYPQTAKDGGINGTCYLKAEIDSSGQIKNIEVMRGVPGCPECDKEAIRLLKIMPKWIPALDRGKPVKTYLNYPLRFKIQ